MNLVIAHTGRRRLSGSRLMSKSHNNNSSFWLEMVENIMTSPCFVVYDFKEIVNWFKTMEI